MVEKITKIDAARKQLVSAVQMFFNNGDPVSVHTLATSAWEIVYTLSKREGIEGLSSETEGRLTTGKRLREDYINKPYRNFFKHADRDPDAVLEDFTDEANDPILILLCEDYNRYCPKAPIESQLFPIWFLAVNREKIDPKRENELTPIIETHFPDIIGIDRYGQKRMGAKALQNSLQDKSLLDDPKTDTREIRGLPY